jgi:hypothetical protein
MIVQWSADFKHEYIEATQDEAFYRLLLHSIVIRIDGLKLIEIIQPHPPMMS